MTFVSFEYLALLVATVALYHVLPGRARLALLLVASYVFYCYWEPWYGYVIGSTTLVDYLAALGMEQSQDPRRRRLYLWASLALNLGMLGYFKYTNFALATLRPLLGQAGLDVPFLHVVLPVGISFYTFQEMSYTLDVYHRRIQATRDPLLFAAYVSFFPQLVAGPIERFSHLMPQLTHPAPFDFGRMQRGVGLIFIGLFKKLCLADRLMPFLYPRFQHPEAFDGWELLLGLAAMLVALYLDFGGYTDIARGSARLLGIDLVKNFDFPFTARNPGELWQRWHISLTTWMRDYVFVAMPGSPTLSLLLPAALLGLWHGAAWKFVLWGIGNGLALAAYVLWRINRKTPGGKGGGPVAILGTACFYAWSLMLMSLFFCPDVSTAVAYWQALFTHPWAAIDDPSLIALALFLVVFMALQFAGRYTAWRERWDALPGWVHGLAFAVLFYAVVFFSVPVGQKFVYMQF
jgi:D-alanyl-lipoteichoic acid acyltransferase DltB (MBOAT superfamily)